MNDEVAPRRVGVIIFTHTDYGRALMNSTEGILGVQDGYEVLSVDNDVDVAAIMDDLRAAVERLNTGGGVVIFTDMFGGTPSNLAISILGSLDVEIITGVNLPMLLRAFSRRDETLVDLAREVREAGVQGIVVAGEILRQKSNDG
jgi:PTS system mannose-specific IIA component